MKLSQTVRKKARIEIIPLIDVIMFLMAAFVLVMLAMNKNKQIPVELPQAGAPSLDQPTDKPVTIGVDSAGDYFWDNQRITLDDIIVRLNGLKAQVADPKIVIDGEIGAQFGRTVVIVDEARNAGINKVTFNTTPRVSIR